MGTYTIWCVSLSTEQSAEASCIALKTTLRDFRGIRMHYVEIVTEAHNSAILEISCEKVFWPEASIFHPGLLSMTAQAVDKDNTTFRGS